ncbi:MAG TPA: proline dehydrogenase family protein [Gemmatimonadaceae bacterium]|nr:proline dehydrogenase family protein [Gemmatimonadaceae bacterium]
MQIMRSTLLWASRNGTLERVVRSSRMMRPLVSRFMPGETIEEAMAAVRSLHAERTPTILTYLGENVNTDAAADQTVEEYERLFAAVHASGADVHVSIKLTQFGWDVDRSRALDRVRAMARLALAGNTMLPIDMEGSAYVESTVDAYEQLAREFDNVALCLQAYLHRTPQDVQRLLRIRPYIRLVKGAYREPATIALQGRPDIDGRYRALGQQLLEASKAGGGARVAFGTHDIALVDLLRADARAAGVGESSFEVQMLYGIQDAARRQLAAAGMRTRVLISYGRAWYPWFMRRLAEKPANLLLVGRNIVGR